MQLSGRLKRVAEMITEGGTLSDVGCDHAYLSIYAVEEGISPKAIASDVREGPLSHARANIAAHHLEDRISLRLGSGLSALAPGEAQSLVLAGMGGMLIIRLLEEEREKALSFRELILSPQSDLYSVRKWLAENGFRITDEAFLYDEGKPYVIIKAVPGKSSDLPEWAFAYGKILQERSVPEYRMYLEKEAEKRRKLLEELSLSGDPKERTAIRIAQISKELDMIRERLHNLR